MRQLRIGVIGAGGIAQVEHIPNLLRLPALFRLAGVYDPSRTAREFVTSRHGVPTFATEDALFALELDAVLVASPDALHHGHVKKALGLGLHVFCEKPLCYDPADIDDLIAARERAGKVLQVGYMKRFDPSYEAALRLMPGVKEKLSYVSVEVNDPDAWPFIRHHDWARGEDVDKALIADAQARQREQAERAVGRKLEGLAFKGYVGPYCSAIVHDVNAVHGLLEAMGVPEGQVSGAELFAHGNGGQASVRLMDGQAVWNMAHVTLPALSDYRERISFWFEDASLELEFPSPYLNHQPTRLTLRRSNGHVLHVEDIRTGYEEAFVEELKGFWSAIQGESPCRNSAEQARRDMALLAGLARHYVDHH